MKFTLSIKCDNAAFSDGAAGLEVARILREVARKVEGDSSPQTLFDDNGNRVGSAKFTGRQSRD